MWSNDLTLTAINSSCVRLTWIVPAYFGTDPIQYEVSGFQTLKLIEICGKIIGIRFEVPVKFHNDSYMLF